MKDFEMMNWKRYPLSETRDWGYSLPWRLVLSVYPFIFVAVHIICAALVGMGAGALIVFMYTQ